GYEDRDEDACKTRVHTLVSAYRSYKDECEKTGNGTPKRKPAFFDEVDEFLSKKTHADNEEEDNEKLRTMNQTKSCLPSAAAPASAAATKQPANFLNQTRVNKRKVSTTDALTQIDKALEAFVSYQQAADRSFLAAEEARERREEEREEREEGRKTRSFC
ncbi:unnamed protein product, partial [Pocillopora meandrina]